MSEANASTAHHDEEHHGLPLWGLFLAMVAFTAVEVGLYEIWKESAIDAIANNGEPFISKLTLVLIIFVFTLPKAAIVLIWFMHLKFEKSIIISLCVLPFIFAAIAIFVPLADSETLEGDEQVYIEPPKITGHAEYPGLHTGKHENTHEDSGAHADEHKADDAAAEDEETYP